MFIWQLKTIIVKLFLKCKKIKNTFNKKGKSNSNYFYNLIPLFSIAHFPFQYRRVFHSKKTLMILFLVISMLGSQILSQQPMEETDCWVTSYRLNFQARVETLIFRRVKIHYQHIRLIGLALTSIKMKPVSILRNNH